MLIVRVRAARRQSALHALRSYLCPVLNRAWGGVLSHR